MTIVHTLTIDSRDRDYDASPSPSQYRIMLPRKYRRVTGARLLTAEIPSSFYVFRSDAGNTTMTMTVASSTEIITIPDGNYNAESFAITLEDALREIFILEWHVSIDQRTLKLTISNDDNVEFTIESWNSIQPTQWGLGYYAGFDKNVTYTSTNSTITSPKPVNLNPVTYIILDIQELNNIDEGGVHGTVVGGRAFAKIPVQVDSFQYAFLDMGVLQSPLVSMNPELPTLDRLHITMRYHDGTLVNFHDIEHSLSLEIHTRELEDPPQNTGNILANAASTAAATAAAAAVTATELQRNRYHQMHDALDKQQPTSFWKMYRKHLLYTLIVIIFIFYMYKKRTLTYEQSLPRH